MLTLPACRYFRDFEKKDNQEADALFEEEIQPSEDMDLAKDKLPRGILPDEENRSHTPNP